MRLSETLENYGASEVKKHVDIMDAYFQAKSQKDRRTDTARVLTFFALAESGEKRGKKLTEQRQYLRKSFPGDEPSEMSSAPVPENPSMALGILPSSIPARCCRRWRSLGG